MEQSSNSGDTLMHFISCYKQRKIRRVRNRIVCLHHNNETF